MDIDSFDRYLSVFDIVACIADFAVIYYFIRRERQAKKKPFFSRISKRRTKR